MAAGDPKRHHYLPESYLDGFTDAAGMLAVYDRQSREYRGQQPNGTAVVGHLYSHVLPDGSKDPAMERKLADEIDGHFPQLRGELEKEHPAISPSDATRLFGWIAALSLRTPRMLEFFKAACYPAMDAFWAQALENENSARAIAAELFGVDSEIARGSLDEIKAYFADLDARYPRSNSILRTVADMMDEGHQLLHSKGQITILRAPSGARFITSDCGVMVHQPTPSNGIQGYLGPGSSLLVPLSKHAALELNDGPFIITKRLLGRREMDEINIAIAQSSRRFVVADNEQWLRSIVTRARLESPPANAP